MPSVDRRHQLYIIIGIIASLLILIAAINIAGNRISTLSRATSSVSTSEMMSLENSYVFASPISALSNGTSVIRITIFVLDEQGLGILGKKVDLSIKGSLVIVPVQQVTDQMGRAIFDLTCENPGNYTINASVSGATLPQAVQISFR